MRLSTVATPTAPESRLGLQGSKRGQGLEGEKEWKEGREKGGRSKEGRKDGTEGGREEGKEEGRKGGREEGRKAGESSRQW